MTHGRKSTCDRYKCQCVECQAAKDAARAHASESAEHMKPAHIIQRVKQSVRAVEGGTMSPRRIDCGQEDREHRWLPGGTCMLCETRAWELTGGSA